MLDLVTAGEVFDDLVFHGLARLPRLGEEIKTNRFERSVGGGAVITAIAGARLGLRCGVLGDLSEAAVRQLRGERVQVRNLRQRGEPCAISVALSTARDRAFVTFNGMHDRLPGRIRSELRRVPGRHVHLAFCPPACRPWIDVLRALRRRGVTTSWDFGWNPGLLRDPHFRPLIASLDYLFVNREEALLYSATRRLAAAVDSWRGMPGQVVIKLGAEGSRLTGGGTEIHVPSFTVRVVDTTGAGDAFNAGFLAARLRGLEPRAALKIANRVGALSTRRPGGIAGLPNKER